MATLLRSTSCNCWPFSATVIRVCLATISIEFHSPAGRCPFVGPSFAMLNNEPVWLPLFSRMPS